MMAFLPSSRVFLITNLLGAVAFLVIWKLIPTLPWYAVLIVGVSIGFLCSIIAKVISDWIDNSEDDGGDDDDDDGSGGIPVVG
jgi:hypothetical protein